jgi:hypothetical protein
LLSSNQPGSRPPPRTSSARPDYNKPPPPAPSRQGYHPDDRYAGRGGGGGGYDSRPPLGAYNDPRYDGRGNGPRYDQGRPETRYDGYNGYGSPPPQNYGQGPPPQVRIPRVFIIFQGHGNSQNGFLFALLCASCDFHLYIEFIAQNGFSSSEPNFIAEIASSC